MLELLLSAGGGGLFGIFGSIAKKFGDYKMKKLELAHAVSMAKEDRESMKMEMDLAKVKGEIDLELADSQADALGLQSAIKAEASITGAAQWVTNLRGSVRPILTYALSALAISMAWLVPENEWNNDIIFMAMTAVGYWFGDSPRRN